MGWSIRFAGVVAILLVGAGGWMWTMRGEGAGGRRVVDGPQTVVEAAALPVFGPVVTVPEFMAGAVAPSFDVVRVGPSGAAVIAGRAAPGAEVVVRDGVVDVARARAGRDGTFIALPAAPLAAGARELTLATPGLAGGAEVKGDGSVLLVVPAARSLGQTVAQPGPGLATAAIAAPAADVPGVVALLVPDAGRPRVLAGPQPAELPRDGASGPTLDAVDYDDGGGIRFTGGGAMGEALRVYLDNLPRGEVRPDWRGRWTLAPAGTVSAGVHSLRVDQVDAGGRVVARVEVPFERASVSAAVLAAAGGRVVVQPGQSLWRLARAAYGRGVAYRMIYLANREQIRDPGLIYPGQVFAVPRTTSAGGGG